ncbi:MAG TPA: N-acetylmuramoyl-L-alanine amidase [Streptomyces sp.]|uniref:N-acetylmuramoyl-L-alanine amidase n=1 Tax=Streptomyces sp. TaxID=1931 RepID=UPI002D3257AB|nr:N-acetylmuramoyl-L-alanine amidase [Streptomyces sp.]HZG05200.1 N-acetylmuramoyl-L-alanine amidase [Streptomyces sp.]
MSLGRRLFVILAIALPVCLAGWLTWHAGRRTDQGPASGRPSSPASPAPSAAEEGAEPDGSARPLRGTVVVIDPGHHPDNHEHTREIARQVDIGTGRKECDTTGTATDSGYAEAAFTLDVARRARAILQRRGATVEFTHDGDRPYGPCIDERARAGNEAGADAAVSVHADGSADGNRGFHVIVPARVARGDADTRRITGPSRRLGEHLVDAFAEATGSKPAGYLGTDVADTGLVTRGDLGGLNLSRVPKVFLECGNMRDPRDARLLTDPRWRERAARGIADGVTAYLREADGPSRVRPHGGTGPADPADRAGRPSVR